MDVLPLFEVGERVVRDQGFPLLQRRGVDRLGEPELLLADLRDGGDHLLPGEVTAEDGVAAVDVRGDVLEPRFRQGFAEGSDGELGGPADAAEQEDVRRLRFGFRHGGGFTDGAMPPALSTRVFDSRIGPAYAGSVTSATTVPSSFVIVSFSSFLVAVPGMSVANFGCGAPPTNWPIGWPSFLGIHR